MRQCPRINWIACEPALSQVRHPNVVGISDIGTLDDGIPFLILEYVPGVTLREILRTGPVENARARAILLGIGRALCAAHKAGVWHLDIKPENVIISEPGSGEERVKLIDFGIARLKHSRDGASLVAGSPNYMAPEQETSPSALCDLYAVSLVAFELFTGHLPRDTEQIDKQLPTSLDTRTVRAISKGLEPAPTARFSDVVEFIEEVKAESENPRSRVFATVVAAIAIATAGYFGFRYLQSSSAQFEYSKPVSILASPAVERQPAFSPDGSEIYYSLGEIGRRDIYKKLVSGGDAVQFVSNPSDDYGSQVSPDGKFLVFIRRGATIEIVRKSLMNGQEEILSAGIDIDTYTWAADGERLVFSGILNGSQKLQVLAIGTKTISPLEFSGLSDCGLFHPSLSPDGQFIAFACRWAQGSDDLFVARVAADLKPIGSATRFTSKRDRIESVKWAPDSKSVLYVGGPLGNGSVWRVDTQGTGGPVRVSNIPEQIETIAVARKKWMLGYSRHLSTTNIWKHQLGDRLSPRQLVASGHGDGEGRLSPDGQMLLFASGRSGSVQEWLADADGGNVRQLTKFDGADVVTAIWSADSKEAIISVRSKDVGERIYRTPVRGPVTLSRLLEGAMATSVSRDGKWLYVTKVTGKKRSIWRTQYAESATTELIADGGEFGMESPDGRSFYFAKRAESEGIWLQPLPSGPLKRIVESIHRRNLFSVGKSGIFYIGPLPSAEHPALYFKGFQFDAAPKMLLRFERPIGWGISLSPDENTLIFTQVDVANADIMLIERFR